jgi:hypothetical protein
MAFLNRRASRLALVALLCVLGLAHAQADRAALTEAEVKAGLLYNFATFVEWPDAAEPGRPFAVCVEGADDVAGALRAVEGRSVRGRTLAVRRMSADMNPAGCDLLFISSDSVNAARLLAEVRDRPVLTVGDHEHFSRMGGTVRLFAERSRIRFEIDVARAERSKLKVSSKLLGLARVLRNGNVVTP